MGNNAVNGVAQSAKSIYLLLIRNNLVARSGRSQVSASAHVRRCLLEVIPCHLVEQSRLLLVQRLTSPRRGWVGDSEFPTYTCVNRLASPLLTGCCLIWIPCAALVFMFNPPWALRLRFPGKYRAWAVVGNRTRLRQHQLPATIGLGREFRKSIFDREGCDGLHNLEGG